MPRKDGGGVGGNNTSPVPLALPRPNPPGPPCQGGKGHAPDEGFFNSPSRGGVISNHRERYIQNQKR